MVRLLSFIFLMSFATTLMAQNGDVDSPENELFRVDAPVNLDFTQEEAPIQTKKKKPKKKVFYGLKTRKGFTRKGYGDRVTYELFFYLKHPQLPDNEKYIRDIYYYDFARHEIRKTAKFDPKKGALLHGPYEKRQGSVLLEKGIFYKGTKHGRWMAYNRDSVLTDKEYYFKGWPKESLVGYFDPMEHKHMREIIPIEYGDKEGYYFMFFESGQVAVTGEYHWDQKVGDWTEYYPSGQRKKVISYPAEPFNKSMPPFIKNEYNAQGREVYRNLKNR